MMKTSRPLTLTLISNPILREVRKVMFAELESAEEETKPMTPASQRLFAEMRLTFAEVNAELARRR